MAIVDGKIRCSSCKEWKTLEAFIPSHQLRGFGECRGCKAAWKKAKYWRDPELSAKIARESRRAWREKARDKDNATARAWLARNKRKSKNYSLARYGISLDEYEILMAGQRNCCAICGTSENSDGKQLYVDHCHTTGRIRGLLCRKCNTGLGLLGDSIGHIERALAYLKGEKLCELAGLSKSKPMANCTAPKALGHTI